MMRRPVSACSQAEHSCSLRLEEQPKKSHDLELSLPPHGRRNTEQGARGADLNKTAAAYGSLKVLLKALLTMARAKRQDLPLIITLTTDFGLTDPYVGIMKGVIAGITPDARAIDLTHEVRPQDIRQASFLLSTAVPFFPAGAVHVVVVDPGVGSRRRALAAACQGQFFVAPDNGVLSHVFLHGTPAMVELTNRKYWLPTISNTFHGRDIFAPVAAHLAAGVSLTELGAAIDDPVRLDMTRPVRHEDGSISGHVQYIDHFGNCMTDVPAAMLVDPVSFSVRVADGPGLGPVRSTYADVVPGAPLALIGSAAFVEIAVRGGSAAERLALHVGSAIRLEPQGAG
jgi:S-adenosylmethionine hydrolase